MTGKKKTVDTMKESNGKKKGWGREETRK